MSIAERFPAATSEADHIVVPDDARALTGDQLDDSQPTLEAQATDERTLSPFANKLRNLGSYLEQRAIKRAYGRANRQEWRQNTIETIKDMAETGLHFAQKTGSIALHAAAEAGTITVGVGVLAGEAAIDGTRKAYETGRDIAETAALKAVYASEAVAGTVRDVAETGALETMYVASTAKEVFSNAKDNIKEKLEKRSAAAKTRRAARRERWTARKELFLNTGKETLASAAEKARRAAAAPHIGLAAINAAAIAARQAVSETTTDLRNNL